VRLGPPFAATLTSEAFYPPHVLLVLLLGPVWGIQAALVFHAGLASAGAYFASRKLGAGRWGGVLAGAFGLTPLATRLAGSLHMLSAMAWSGWVVIAAINLARRPSVATAAWLALPLGLSFHCGAPEVVLWQSALALGFALTSQQRMRAVLFTALAGGWCFALSAIAVFPAAELWKASVVPGGTLEDRYDWSTAPAQLLSMFWPFADEKRSPDVFGRDQWLATSLFVGAIPGLLAVLSLRRNKKLLVVAAVGCICAVLCLGRFFPPAKLLLSLPPFSGFRHPVKYAFGLSFCIALLSGQGLRRVAAWARKDRPRVFQVAAALVGGMALIPLLQALAGLAPWREGMKSGALWFGFAVILCSLSFALFSGPHGGARRVRVSMLILALGEVAIAGVMMGHVALVDARKVDHPGVLAAQIRSEPHGRASIFLEGAESQAAGAEVSAYPPLDFIADARDLLIGLTPMQEELAMVEGYGFREPWRLQAVLEDNPRGPYDLFGVTHYVRHGSAPFPDLEAAGTTGMKGWAGLWRSKTAFPRAWVVQQAAVVKELEAVTTVRDHADALKTKVLLPDGEAATAEACSSDVTYEPKGDESISVRGTACEKGYLVVSDGWFPGWVATLDGQPAKILRADFLIEAIAVPKGPFAVQIDYRPWSFRLGALITVVASLALIAVLAAKNRRKLLKPQETAVSSR
jgi:hypothetical protein